jgi:hypothetical protein
MKEISTEKIKVGEHVIIDGVEYVAEKSDKCSKCVFNFSGKCSAIPCFCDRIFKKVKKEPKYRPYKDTDEMIADYKERFSVSNVPAFCMPLIWIMDKSIPLITLITDFAEGCVRLHNVPHTMEELFDEFTYLDGSPCGKETE